MKLKLIVRYWKLRWKLRSRIELPLSDSDEDKIEYAKNCLSRESILDEIHKIRLVLSGEWRDGEYIVFEDKIMLSPKIRPSKGGGSYTMYSGDRQSLAPYFKSSGTSDRDWLISVADYFLEKNSNNDR